MLILNVVSYMFEYPQDLVLGVQHILVRWDIGLNYIAVAMQNS